MSNHASYQYVPRLAKNDAKKVFADAQSKKSVSIPSVSVLSKAGILDATPDTDRRGEQQGHLLCVAAAITDCHRRNAAIRHVGGREPAR
jgi:hypothetical protein